MIKLNSFKHISASSSYLLSLFLLLLISGCRQSDESQIKDSCNRFMKGRLALKRNGDSLQLKAVTEDSLFRVLMLNHQYLEMLDAPVMSPDLRSIEAKTVELNGNCASCLMSGEYYKLQLCKEVDTWKVKGENDIYATAEMITKATNKILEQKIYLKEKPGKDSVLKVTNAFFSNVKKYFKDQNPEALKNTCNEGSIHFIERLYAFVKQKNMLDLLYEEMEKPDYTPGEIKFEGENVEYKLFREEGTILLQRQNNSFIITGFNGMDSKNISDKIIKEQYADLLRSMKIFNSAKYRHQIIN